MRVRSRGDVDPTVLALPSSERLRLDIIRHRFPGSYEALSLITDPQVFRSRILNPPPPRPRVGNLSRGLLSALKALTDAGLVEMADTFEENCPFFLVPKPNEGTFRLIQDARPVNAIMSPPPRAPVPSVRDVLHYLFKHRYCFLSDGKRFFYQFPLHPDIRPFFGARLASRRGDVVPVQSMVLPMGWSYAPWVAQKVAAELVSELGIAYLDNFILAGDTRTEAIARARAFLDRATDVNLQLDNTDPDQCSQQFTTLGVDCDLHARLLRLSPTFTASIPQVPLPGDLFSVRDVFVLSGYLMWYCTVMNVPICTFSATMAFLSQVSRAIAITGWSSPVVWSPTAEQAFDELRSWRQQVTLNEWRSYDDVYPVTEAQAHIYSDASDTHCAYLIFSLAGQAVAQRAWVADATMHIFYKEAEALLSAIHDASERGFRQATAFVDNMPLVLVMKKRLAKDRGLNQQLAALPFFPHVHWVPTSLQLADPFTRGHQLLHPNAHIDDFAFLLHQLKSQKAEEGRERKP